MSVLRLYVTKDKYLPQLEVKDGNLIFLSDNGKICLDFNGARYQYDTIQNFKTNADREAHALVTTGYYFVEEDNSLWRYSNNNWHRITPENLDPIVFGKTLNDFPPTGNPKLLYVADKATYKWDSAAEKYIAVANLTEWDTI